MLGTQKNKRVFKGFAEDVYNGKPRAEEIISLQKQQDDRGCMRRTGRVSLNRPDRDEGDIRSPLPCDRGNPADISISDFVDCRARASLKPKDGEWRWHQNDQRVLPAINQGRLQKQKLPEA